MHRRNGTPLQIIENEHDIAEATRALRRRCAVMRRIHDAVGDPPVRRFAPGFESLARIIVAQQLSAASAAAIWTRAANVIAPFVPGTLLSTPEGELRACGLSRPKIATLRALATAATNIDFDAMAHLSDDQVRERLTAISGIGPWTCDIYIMFAMGRADGWASGDLALRMAAQRAFALKAVPTPGELEALAEQWRPWRGVAARLLWAYHAARRAPAANLAPDWRRIKSKADKRGTRRVKNS